MLISVGLTQVPFDPSEPSWLDASSENALRAVIPDNMLPASVALYARWWQLETWLRELAYVELRALLGIDWISSVKVANSRLTQDAAFTHMAGPDSENPLAYLDYSQLVDLIERYWSQFHYALFEQRAWQGRQDELKRIRHRIGHLRRPHADDLTRLELTLRDLERGAFIALASYNDTHEPDPREHKDVITNGWINRRHSTARRLIDHAWRQYDTRLLVQFSRRPWASAASDLAGAAGIIWHADFIMRDGRAVDLGHLWHYDMMEAVRPSLLHVLSDYPSRVRFTFSAVDDPQEISDAIGELFDIVLLVSKRIDYEKFDLNEWTRTGRTLDYRVQTATGWTNVDETTLPISTFRSGGGVTLRPTW